MSERKTRSRKLSHDEFWRVLRKERGIFARAARTIEKEFGITYTRQAVQARAMADQDQLRDILEEGLDIAEETLHDLMRSPLPNIRLKAVELFLKSKGASRGYQQRETVAHTGEVAVNVTFVDESVDRP